MQFKKKTITKSQLQLSIYNLQTLQASNTYIHTK